MLLLEAAIPAELLLHFSRTTGETNHLCQRPFLQSLQHYRGNRWMERQYSLSMMIATTKTRTKGNG